MHKILYKSTVIDREYTVTLLEDIISSMGVPQGAIHRIYVCNSTSFKETAIEIGYLNNLDTKDYTVHGIAFKNNILLKDFLLCRYRGLEQQIYQHSIRHEIGHTIDDYYRGIHIYNPSNFVEEAYEQISAEYNAEKYCREFNTPELSAFLKEDSENEKDKLINLIGENKILTPEIRPVFLNSISKIYSYKSFLKICNMDHLFCNIKHSPEFEELLISELNLYVNEIR